MKRVVLCLTVFCFFVVAAWAAPLVGKVTLKGEGAAEVIVQAWPLNVLDFSGTPPYVTGPSAIDGRFALDLPPGQYHLIAQGEGVYCFYGRNPIAVSEEGLGDINLPLVARSGVLPERGALVESGAMGLITHDGKPVAQGFVYVYPDLSAQFKGFGLGISAPTGGDGFFEVPLPPGSYYLIARVRQGGGAVGPLQSGDLFGYWSGNPLVLKDGEVARVHIPLIEVPEKVARHAASMFGSTRFRGSVVDVSGRPVEGVKVLLYADPAMLERPLYVSQPTGKDGSFVLSFPDGGVYFLAARDKLGGTPAPGELYGRYQGVLGNAIEVKSGEEISDIEITVEEVW